MDKLPRHGELFLHVTGPGEKGKKHRNLKLNSPVAKLPLHRLTRDWRVTLKRGVAAKKAWPKGTYYAWVGLWDPNLNAPLHRYRVTARGKTRKEAVLLGTFTHTPESPKPSKGVALPAATTATRQPD